MSAMNNYVEELEQVGAELVSIEAELQELLTRQSSLIDRREQLQVLIEECEDSSTQNDAHDWEQTDFPWTEDLDKKLKEVFKLQELRPMQRQTMNATLDKKDTLLIMPTGGGKSLCFQLPALVDKGVTLVVSPLVSLMEDQQMALEQLGVKSAMLNAATSKEDLKWVQDEMVNANGSLKLLYVTPEKLAKSKRFMNRLEKCYSIGNLARIVIDEVHCCSQWGHDFRPDYKFLGIMKRQFPNAPILGLTATATSAVLEDVKKILNIPRAILFKASFNRPNLFYEVQPKPSSQKETLDEIYQLISRRFTNQSGIIYCFSRKETEEVTSELMSRGIRAGCYHADIDAVSRSRIHRNWLSGKIQVVVATVAFGMGIDKPDVRFVIHHSISKSMENLYQESGRAGRDERRADCIVMYRFADVARQSSMVFTEQTGLNNLHGIVKYCIDVSRCRRAVLAGHFGEVWDSSHCNNMCDHCQGGTTKQREITKYCQDVITLLDAASAIEQRVTSAKLVDAWYGRGPSALKVKSVETPPLDRCTAERVLAHMLVEGFLREDFHFTAYSTICYIVPDGKARLLRNNISRVYMDFKSKSASTTSPDTNGSISSSKQTLSTSLQPSTPRPVVPNKSSLRSPNSSSRSHNVSNHSASRPDNKNSSKKSTAEKAHYSSSTPRISDVKRVRSDSKEKQEDCNSIKRCATSCENGLQDTDSQTDQAVKKKRSLISSDESERSDGDFEIDNRSSAQKKRRDCQTVKKKHKSIVSSDESISDDDFEIVDDRSYAQKKRIQRSIVISDESDN